MSPSDPSTQQPGWVTLWPWLGPTPPSRAVLHSAPSPPPPPSPRQNVRASTYCLPRYYLILYVVSVDLSPQTFIHTELSALTERSSFSLQALMTSTYPCTLTWRQWPRQWPHLSLVWKSGTACGSKSPSLTLSSVRRWGCCASEDLTGEALCSQN